MTSKTSLWLAIGAGAIALVALYNLFGYSPPAGQALSYSELLKETESGRVTDVFIHGEELSGHRSGGERFHSIIPEQPQFLIDALARSGATITIAPDSSNPFLGLMLSWLPFAVFIGVLVHYLRAIARSLRTRRREARCGDNSVGTAEGGRRVTHARCT
jgi:cell division protease FtsH